MYISTGNVEAQVSEAFKSGIDTKEAFKSRCKDYGFTKEKFGTSWDDKCIEHESTNKLGPVFGLGKKDEKKAPRPWGILVAIGGIAALILVLRK
jgi:hypothetical protein